MQGAKNAAAWQGEQHSPFCRHVQLELTSVEFSFCAPLNDAHRVAFDASASLRQPGAADRHLIHLLGHRVVQSRLHSSPLQAHVDRRRANVSQRIAPLDGAGEQDRLGEDVQPVLALEALHKQPHRAARLNHLHMRASARLVGSRALMRLRHDPRVPS